MPKKVKQSKKGQSEKSRKRLAQGTMVPPMSSKLGNESF